MLCRKTTGGGNALNVGEQQDPPASGTIPSTSRSLSDGPWNVGKPDGMAPVIGTPKAGRPSSEEAMIAKHTTASAIGRPGAPIPCHDDQDRDDAEC